MIIKPGGTERSGTLSKFTQLVQLRSQGTDSASMVSNGEYTSKSVCDFILKNCIIKMR